MVLLLAFSKSLPLPVVVTATPPSCKFCEYDDDDDSFVSQKESIARRLTVPCALLDCVDYVQMFKDSNVCYVDYI